MENVDGVLIIKRIHVVYEYKGDSDQRDVIERVHQAHHQKCPVYRSLIDAIGIETELRFSE